MSKIVKLIYINSFTKTLRAVSYPTYQHTFPPKFALQTSISWGQASKTVDNLVDNVDNFYGCPSLHNNDFWSIFSFQRPKSLFIIWGPCSTKFPVDSAAFSVKLFTPSKALSLSKIRYGTGLFEWVLVSSGVGWSGIMSMR